MIRPKRRAAPTKFVDNGSIPEDLSHEDRSISNEEELLKETYSDIDNDSTSSEIESPKILEKPVKKITKVSVDTTKAESTVAKNTVKEKSSSTEKKPAKPKRKFKLLPETITPQNNTPKVTITKIKKIEYETATPILCAKQVAPIIYTARATPFCLDKTSQSSSAKQNSISCGTCVSSFRYTFTIQETLSDGSTKNFTYTSESTLSSEDKKGVVHVVKPQTKSSKKAGKKESNSDSSEKKTIVESDYPIIEKKTVPTRINVKKLTPTKTQKKSNK